MTERPYPQHDKPPDIYEVPARGGAAQLVIRHGCRPAPSPDGKWLTFCSELKGDGASLMLFNRVTQQRRVIFQELDLFSRLIWASDSRYLIVIRPSSATGKYHGRPLVQQINPITGTCRTIASLHTSEFKILSLSKNGKFLFIQVNTMGPLQDGAYTTFSSLQAVNLHNGAITTLCKSDGVDFDWRPD